MNPHASNRLLIVHVVIYVLFGYTTLLNLIECAWNIVSQVTSALLIWRGNEATDQAADTLDFVKCFERRNSYQVEFSSFSRQLFVGSDIFCVRV